MKNRRAIQMLLFGLVISIAGCAGHEHEHEGHDHGEEAAHDDHEEADPHGHGHGHGEDAVAITRHTERLELFAEHPPAISGEELTFLAHLTVLEDFSALEEATVTLVLDGPVHVEASVDEMLRPGIFQPTLTAPSPATYAAKLVVRGSGLDETIDGFEIVVHADAESAAHAGEGGDESGPTPISFLKEQQWQVPFGTAFATRGPVIETVEVSGEVTTPPGGRAEVGAAIPGRLVQPSGGFPRPGQSVRRNELLALIAPAPAAPEAAARADLAVVESETRRESARAALERAERLIADRAISQREVDDARRELRVAEGAVVASNRARDIFSGAASGRGRGTYRVTAPIDGILVEVEATAGHTVTAGEILFRIVDLEELWIHARVPEQEAARIRADHDAAFSLPGIDSWFPIDVTGEDATASVVSVGRSVDRRSRTVDVIYALAEPEERLRVGALLHVAVPAGEAWEGVRVPRSAVLVDEGRAVVFVQTEGESFEERTVRTGPRSGEWVAIERGVVEGERVVTRGGNVIRLAAGAASGTSHGHVH